MNEWIAQHPVFITSVVKVIVLVFLLLTSIAYLTWWERKLVGHIQTRLGPYRVGAHGLLQPLADGLKFLFKEDPTPVGVDKFVYYLAPFIAMSLALASFAMIPFGPGEITIFGHATPLQVANINIGLLVLFAITSLGVYGVALAGWSSNSKYPLLGGLRSSAQMMSYELALTMSVVGVLLMAGSFNLREIIEAQQGGRVPFLGWNILARPLPQILGFFIYFTAAVAETNRAPFDLAEAEQELVGGFHTEYSSFKFAMFFLGEYANMLTVACLATILFFGGWLSPFPASGVWIWSKYIPAAAFLGAAVVLLYDGLRKHGGIRRVVLSVMGIILLGLAAFCARPATIDVIQGPFWFLAKVFVFLCVYIWVRGTLPRFRYDQLMGIGWKLLFPLSLVNVAATAFAIVARQR